METIPHIVFTNDFTLITRGGLPIDADVTSCLGRLVIKLTTHGHTLISQDAIGRLNTYRMASSGVTVPCLMGSAFPLRLFIPSGAMP